MTRFDVELDQQHLQRLGSTSPLTGIVELVWNGVDADAEHVNVEFARNDMEGITEIRVIDDGRVLLARPLRDSLPRQSRANSHRRWGIWLATVRPA
jgi:histidine kinase/DNA gyrase B/HSP90-like ATPase